jgi:GxxExxY protein
MDANSEVLEKELVYTIVNCALAVHNTVGHGLREKTYERALCVEFRHRGISFTQQSTYAVKYRGEIVDEYIPDLEIEGRVIVETKTIETITDVERGQVINYLRITGLKVGIIINFKHARLEWERIVLDSGAPIRVNSR